MVTDWLYSAALCCTGACKLVIMKINFEQADKWQVGHYNAINSTCNLFIKL